MNSNEEPPDELRVRLTWPSQPPADESDTPADKTDTHDVEGEENRDGGQQVSEMTPPWGYPVTPPVPPGPVPQIPGNPEAQRSGGRQGTKPIGRWAATRKAAAARAAAVREQAARAAVERAASERAASERAASERAASERGGAGGRAPQVAAERATDQPTRDAIVGQRHTADPIGSELAAAERAAADRASAERAAIERAAARRAAIERAERAAIERAERAAAERAAANQAAANQAAAQRAAEQQAAAQRAAFELAAAEQAVAQRKAERAAAERAAAEAAARRAAADQAAAERTYPLVGGEPTRTEAPQDPPPVLDIDEDDDDDDGDIGPRRTVTTQELILAGRTDSLQAALASIALRIDALTSTTSTFRNLVSDRITDYAEQVGRLATSASGDLDDYRHLHERSLEQIRRSAAETEDNIRRLARTVGDVESKLGALVAAVRENGDAVDHLTTERDKISDTLLRSLDRVGQQVQAGLEQGMEDATSTLARIEDAVADLSQGRGNLARIGDMIDTLSSERERHEVLWNQVQESVLGLADDRERGADVLARLERAITDVTVGRERGQAKSLSRLEGRVDELATALSGMSGDELVATLTRLDSRLKEMSTELVVGRDRETAKALAQLSAQIDEIAGLIAEGRSDLQPIEARLNRMARFAPTPLDLGDLYARLDALAEAISRQGKPGTAAGPDRDLLERFDQLGQQLGEQLEALRRRIALRARPASQSLDDEAISAIADAVAARLIESGATAFSRTPALPASAPALARSMPQVPGPSPAIDNIAPEGPPRGRSQWRP